MHRTEILGNGQMSLKKIKFFLYEGHRNKNNLSIKIIAQQKILNFNIISSN
jgi:hypothetical protein